MKIIKNFITFEGGEGCGKTTQLKLLKDYLLKTGQNFVITREPGGTPLAEKIRTLILGEDMHPHTEAHLFAAARIEHIQNTILPAVKAGKLVISDRYIHSSVAYQGFGRGLGEDKIWDINSFATDNCMPSAVLFFDVPPSQNYRAVKGEVIDNDRMERQNGEFYEKIYHSFVSMSNDSNNFIIIKKDSIQNTHIAVITQLRQRGYIK